MKSSVISLIFISFLFACSNKKNDPKPIIKINQPSIDTSAYFSGNIDGNPITFAVTNSITNVNGLSTGSSKQINTQEDGPLSQSNYTTALINSEMKPLISFTTETFKYPYTASDSLFKSFFQQTAYKFKTPKQDGVEIVYFVGEEEWSTNSSFGDQSGSSISFSNTEDYIGFNGSGISTTITFSCKVYNSKGSSKTISGKFVGPFLED